uniref:Uncharacterized protein n=1 Tax=Parascaris univalens TaxID=6257 RepID=A0A915A024_PARUN
MIENKVFNLTEGHSADLVGKHACGSRFLKQITSVTLHMSIICFQVVEGVVSSFLICEERVNCSESVPLLI